MAPDPSSSPTSLFDQADPAPQAPPGRWTEHPAVRQYAGAPAALAQPGVVHDPRPMAPEAVLSDEAHAILKDHHDRGAALRKQINIASQADDYALPQSVAADIAPDNQVIAATRGAALQGQITPRQWEALCNQVVGTARQQPAAEGATRQAQDDAEGASMSLSAEARQQIAEHRSRALVQRLSMGLDDSRADYGIPASMAHLVPAHDPTLLAAQAAARSAGITPDQWRGLVRQFFAAAVGTLPLAR